jgi:single-strand DNA-binding protein
MQNFNQVVRLGSDAECRFLQDGTAITNFNGAYNTGFGDSQKTHWVRCTIFGKRGEKIAQMLTKGSQIAIAGELGLNEYTTKDGQQKASLECRVADVMLLGKKEQQEQKPAQAPSADFDDFESDTPF